MRAADMFASSDQIPHYQHKIATATARHLKRSVKQSLAQHKTA